MSTENKKIASRLISATQKLLAQETEALYTVKIWETQESQPEIRKDVPAAHARSLANKGGFYKVQLISDQDVIDLETKSAMSASMRRLHKKAAAKRRSRKTGAYSFQTGQWYKQEFASKYTPGETMYFLAQKRQKNGGHAGLFVTKKEDRRVPNKAKKISVHKVDAQLWDEISESDVPPKVMARFQDRMASVAPRAASTRRTAALKAIDKKVIDAFYDKKPKEGRAIRTDGKVLESLGMSGKFAKWVGNKVEWVHPGGTGTHDSIVRYIKKSWPKNSLPDHVMFRRSAATRRTAPLSKRVAAHRRAALRSNSAPRTATARHSSSRTLFDKIEEYLDSEEGQGALDDMVTDAFLSGASNVNNGGGSSQLEWLLSDGFSLEEIAKTLGL